MRARAIKIDDTGSVLVKKGNMSLWMDIHSDSDGELYADWNKYIFFTNDAQDMKEQKFQEDIENYREFSEVAIAYYEQQKDLV